MCSTRLGSDGGGGRSGPAASPRYNAQYTHAHNKVQSDLHTASPNCPALPVNNAVNHVGWDAFTLATRRLTFFYPTRYLRYILHKYMHFLEWLWDQLGCFPSENYIFPRRKNSLYFYKLFRWKGSLTSFSASTPTSFVNVQIWTVCNSTLGNKFLPKVFLFPFKFCQWRLNLTVSELRKSPASHGKSQK